VAASTKAAIAIAAHPDDIEFSMAGTLLLLKEAGYTIHYFNLLTGNGGSTLHSSSETARIRRREARAGARILGARWYPPVADDLELTYDVSILRRVAAVLREARASIVLTHAPQDYMEDHMTACRLAVTAAFAHGSSNFRTTPSRKPYPDDVAVYHAMPHGFRDGLRRRVAAGAFVDTSSVQATKRRALECHRSQQEWLEFSQGMNSYVQSMVDMSLAVGRMSRRFRHAEGWRRHLHHGFSRTEIDPLRDALGTRHLVNAAYERSLGTHP
jgi:LmbE family N-acetylglucosaminyl deacetylase